MCHIHKLYGYVREKEKNMYTNNTCFILHIRLYRICIQTYVVHFLFGKKNRVYIVSLL
jgi:hypothetical protein